MYFSTQIQFNMDASMLQAIYNQSVYESKERKEQHQRKHQEFQIRLKDSIRRFKEEITDEIEYHLTQAAKSARKECRFQSDFSFNKPLGNVKISTLVYGWYNRDSRTFSIRGFEEIGMTQTPFKEVVEEFEKKGIRVSNISDRNKGFGFWIRADFA